MALTPFRWIVALVAMCIVFSIAVLRVTPNRDRARNTSEGLLERHDTYALQVREAARKLRLATIVDSIRPELSRPSTNAIRVHFGNSVPTSYRGPVDTLVARAAREVRDSGRMGIDVFVVYDTVSEFHRASIGTYGTGTDYVLPQATENRCAVILRIGKAPKFDWMNTHVFQSEQAAQQLLGPCAFYRAFGLPGKEVDLWLRRRGWAFAGDGSWSEATSSLSLAESLWPTAPNMIKFDTPLTEIGVDGSHCAMQQSAACERIVFGLDTARRSRFAFLGQDVLRAPYAPLGEGRLRWYSFGKPLGVRQQFLLADMVRTLGRDRFAKFWTSDDAPTVAFQAASGQSLTEWTSHWLADQYGPPPPNGPVPSVWIMTVSVVLIGIGIFAGIRVNSARQFA
jgi:hypothetical protein